MYTPSVSLWEIGEGTHTYKWIFSSYNNKIKKFAFCPHLLFLGFSYNILRFILAMHVCVVYTHALLPVSFIPIRFNIMFVGCTAHLVQNILEKNCSMGSCHTLHNLPTITLIFLWSTYLRSLYVSNLSVYLPQVFRKGRHYTRPISEHISSWQWWVRR